MFGASIGVFDMDEAAEVPQPPQPVGVTGPEKFQLSATTAMPSRRMRNVFFSDNTPRAGWRFVLYLLLFTAMAFVLSRSMHYAAHHVLRSLPHLWFALIGEGLVLIAAIVAAVIMSSIEKRPFGEYGLPRQSAFGTHFWTGCAWGLLGISSLLLAIHIAGDFSFGNFVLHGARLLKFAAFWGLLFLLVGFFEEFLFRGYTQFTLTQGMGFWPAAILLSTVFGAVHLGNQGEALLGALAASFIALFFCLTLRRTGTLWFAVGFHAAWDWGESYLYSVPDSGQVSPGHLLSSSFHGSRWITGGTVGPEGSVLVFILIAALWLLFDRIYPEAKYGNHIQLQSSAVSSSATVNANLSGLRDNEV